MYEDMTPEKIRGRILGRLKTDLQTREGSFTNDLIAAAAEELSEAYFLPLKNNCFVPYLDYIQKDLDGRD